MPQGDVTGRSDIQASALVTDFVTALTCWITDDAQVVPEPRPRVASAIRPGWHVLTKLLLASIYI